MAYYAWRSPAARHAIASLSASDLQKYEEAERLIAAFPHPAHESDRFHRMTLYGLDGFVLRPLDLDYMIFYIVDDKAEDFTVILLMKA